MTKIPVSENTIALFMHEHVQFLPIYGYHKMVDVYLSNTLRLYSDTVPIGESGTTLYVGLACAVSPTPVNFLLTQLQEALYDDLPV